MTTIRLALVLALASYAISSRGESTLDLPSVPDERVGWRASGELAELLDEMRAAGEASREVFTRLSVEQINWRPPNGTHTPRWNAEHLMATRLLFFSQIYAAIDPDRHQVIRIGPKQMPTDYEAAHPDWTGEQEAAQMKLISDYIQGHAYLLEGLDLDAKPKGSRWVLRALLKRMASHNAEHTANVVKKFELPGWPLDPAFRQ